MCNIIILFNYILFQYLEEMQNHYMESDKYKLHTGQLLAYNNPEVYVLIQLFYESHICGDKLHALSVFVDITA